MVTTWRIAGKTVTILASPALLLIPVDAWVWYLNSPEFTDARLCGNCFLASVGVATELGLIGLLMILRQLMNPTRISTDPVFAFLLVAGILSTPMLAGVPLFVFAYWVLLWRSVRSAVHRVPFVLGTAIRRICFAIA